MLRPHAAEGAYEDLLEASRLWSHAALGATEVVARAARRSGEEARAVRKSTAGTPPPRWCASFWSIRGPRVA